MEILLALMLLAFITTDFDDGSEIDRLQDKTLTILGWVGLAVIAVALIWLGVVLLT